MSEGMLSDSQRKALTLLSLGWLAVALVPADGISSGRRRNFVYVVGYNFLSKSKKPKDDEKRRKRDDEEIMAIIRTFISWEH